MVTGCHFIVFQTDYRGKEMASERFMRLPPEKQMVIYEAAIDEFINTPFEKVSINKIIQKAGISRGSFYTYFEDKRELLSFVMENTKEQWRNFCLDYLKKSGGDFWSMMESMLDAGLEFCRANDMVRLHQNLMMYQEFKVIVPPIEAEAMKLIRSQLYSQVNISRFREESMEFFTLVLEQAVLMVFHSIVSFYANPEREEKIKEDYKKKMNILRYGACKPVKQNQMEEMGVR